MMADVRSPLRRRVVLFPCPLQGHMNPMFQLAAALHSRGFSITVIHTEFNAPQASKHPDFRFVPIPDGLTQEIKVGDDIARIFVALNANVKGALRDRLEEVVRRGEEEEEDAVACLIADNIMYAGRVAEEVGVPNFVLVTVSAALFHTLAVPPLPLDSRRDDSEHQIRAPPLRERDLPLMENSNLKDASDFTQSVMAAASASRALIWNTIEGLEADSLAILQQQLHQTQIFPIGPLHELSPNTYESFLPQDSTCLEWLDQQKPGSVLYVSFGSMACFSDRRELLEVAWGLAASGQPFLWVLRPGSVRGEQQPKGKNDEFPEEFEEAITGGRGKVVRWAPQQEVLGHRAVGGFWTHGGWNSVLESICKGVPMLCGPCSGDQKVNARYVTHVWEVGVPLESGLERGEIEKAIKRLMMVGDAMRKRILDLKAEADRCLRDGGSSRRHLDKLLEFIIQPAVGVGEKNERGF